MLNLQAESALITPDLKTTSLIVAEKFGKRHDHVLRDIRNLDIPNEYRLPNFGEIDVFRHSQLNGAPIKSKAYEMTRDGFALLVMGFTGKKAMAWKIKFLQAFNEMERELSAPVITGNIKRPYILPEPIGFGGTRRKISARNVLDIVEMSHRGYSRKEIAKHMQCSIHSVGAVLNGDRHADVTGISKKSSFKYKPLVTERVETPVSKLNTIFDDEGFHFGDIVETEPVRVFPKQRTLGGSYFDPFDLKADCIYIGDIAHTLSNLCCFTGHTDTFHSIADHCVNLSRQFLKFSPELRMQALLYHSPAAYLGPMTSGLRKRLPKLICWEDEIRELIYSKHGLKGEPPQLSIVSANKHVLAKTAKEMMGVEDDEIVEDWGIVPLSEDTEFIHSRTITESYSAFLVEFDEIARLLKK